MNKCGESRTEGSGPAGTGCVLLAASDWLTMRPPGTQGSVVRAQVQSEAGVHT